MCREEFEIPNRPSRLMNWPANAVAPISSTLVALALFPYLKPGSAVTTSAFMTIHNENKL